jgi:uncharacterized protein YvpB
MPKHKKHKHIHPIRAYIYIIMAFGFSVWLISIANPNKVEANETGSFNEIITEKDNAAQIELLKPDVVLSTEDKIDQVEEIKQIENPTSDSTNLSATILPSGNHQSIKSIVTVLFSTAIEKDSFEKSFTIVPNVAGEFRVNGRIGTFTPYNSLSPDTKYEIQINKNIVGLKGEKLVDNTIGSFTTNPENHILAVPYYRQQFSRSCEAASLRMALAYKGIITDDKEIVDLAGYDPREPDFVNKTWDDPNKMFVGFLSGKQVGYGMYAPALAKASVSLGSTGKVLKNPTSSEIAEAVWNNNPVVIWGYIKNTVPKLSYFYTETGKKIPIYSNEHARVVVGVVGSIDNPVGFYVHDPLSGVANEYWTADNLSKHMSIFGGVSNQALIVE